MKNNFLRKTRQIVPILFLTAIFLTLGCNPPAEQTPEEPNTANVNWANKVIYEVNIRQHTAEGTIEAFRAHLPRLQEMGVDILWLMPIFPISETNRKATQKMLVEEIEDPAEREKYLESYYAIKDYRAVNPEFGTIEEFKALVKEIHDLGMFVILDIAVNHTGWDHEWITTHPEYYTRIEEGAEPWKPEWMEAHPEFYNRLKELGMTYPMDQGETDWWDTADLNYDNDSLRSEMKDILKFWIEECNVDGYRCDVAGMVPLDFWDNATAEIGKIKPLFMLAENEGPELLVNAFDMDYGWWIMHAMNQIAKGEQNATYLDTVLINQKSQYQEDDIRMYFTTNHDENSWNGTVFERYGDAVKTFAALTFTLPGMPLLYSGQEAGLNKPLRFFEKDTISWDNIVFEDFYKTLIDLRTRNEAMWSANKGGELVKLKNSAPEKTYTFARIKEDSKVIALFNFSNEDLLITIDFNENKGTYKEVFSGEEYTFGESAELSLSAYGYLILE